MKEYVENPGLQKAQKILDEYIRRDFLVQINGLCMVKYQGRAKSKLDRGERIVIKKQDSAILVHGPENYQPKNWQPDVDSFDIQIQRAENEEYLVLNSKRNDPEEIVEIKFEEVDFLMVDQLVDKSELTVKGDELDIHESIEENPELIEDNLKVVEREKETQAGFIDVFCRDSDDGWVVIEVKRNPDYNTVLQLQRYVDEIEKEYSGNIRGILVAPKITGKVLDYLEERNLEYENIEMKDVISDYETLDRSQKGLSDFKSEREL